MSGSDELYQLGASDRDTVYSDEKAARQLQQDSLIRVKLSCHHFCTGKARQESLGLLRFMGRGWGWLDVSMVCLLNVNVLGAWLLM